MERYDNPMMIFMVMFTRKIVALVFSFALLILQVNAADLTWDGGGDGSSFTDGNNWNPDQVPTTSSPYDDLIFGAVDPGIIVIAAAQSANSLTFTHNNSFDLQVNSGSTFNLRGNAVNVQAGSHKIGGPSTARLQLNANATFTISSGSNIYFYNFGPNGKNVLYTGGGNIEINTKIYNFDNFQIDSGFTVNLSGHLGNGGTSGTSRLNDGPSGGGVLQGDGSGTLYNCQIGAGTTDASFSGMISRNLSFFMGDSNSNVTMVQTLSGNNNYTGITKIWNGTLLVTGSHVGGDSYIINGRGDSDQDGFLAGSGCIILADNTKTFTVGDADVDGGDAVIYPGLDATDTGTLTLGSAVVSANVIFDVDGVLRVDLGTSGNSDRLVINGDLELGASANLEINSLLNAYDGSAYTILTYTGSMNGRFLNMTELAPNYRIYYGLGAVKIAPVARGTIFKIE